MVIGLKVYFNFLLAFHLPPNEISELVTVVICCTVCAQIFHCGLLLGRCFFFSFKMRCNVPTDTGGWAELIEINHDDKFVTTERFEISQHMKRLTLGSMTPKRKDVERRLTSPIINTCLDTKNIAFER